MGVAAGGRHPGGPPGGLRAEPGFPEKHYLEPETEVNLQGESWTERRGIQGPGGEHVPRAFGELRGTGKAVRKKTEGEQGQVRQGLGSHVGESELKKSQEEEWEYGLCVFPFTFRRET